MEIYPRETNRDERALFRVPLRVSESKSFEFGAKVTHIVRRKTILDIIFSKAIQMMCWVSYLYIYCLVGQNMVQYQSAVEVQLYHILLNF